MTIAFTSRQKYGLILGIPLFLAILLLPGPEGMPAAAHRTLAVAILMAFWWITESLPIPVTSLLPLVLFPLFNVCSAQEAASQFGDSNIFLFMGGFFIAAAIEKWGLHKRIALKTISILGTSPEKILLGIMVATAWISMWISNTATAVMMLPIATAIIKHISDSPGNEESGSPVQSGFAIALVLGVAYSASIGGIGTLIGTPPNIIFITQVKKFFPDAPEITFLDWLLVGFPLVMIFIPVAWLYLIRRFSIRALELPGSKSVIKEQLHEMGKMSRGEKQVSVIFILTALAWIFRRSIDIGIFTIPGWSNILGIENTVHDSTVAVFSALLLFIIPANFKKGDFLLDWKTAVRIPWGILLLFGGGLALAQQFQASGLAEWMATQLNFLKLVPVFLAFILVVLIMDFLTEVTSNTAIISIFLPILVALSISMNVHPYLFMIGGTIACSLAFMLPVATPPNAVIFSSGYVTIPQMVRTGFYMNLLGLVITTIIVYAIAIPVFGISFSHLPVWIK